VVECGTEQDLIERARTGDIEAFGDLVHLYERPVFNLAYRMLGDSGEAEDASQEAFMKAYTNLQRYDPERSFKTWLLSITSHHCVDRLRKRRLHFLSLDERLAPHPALVSYEDSPEQQTILHERSAFIQDLLATLSEEYRLVLILRYWYDLSYLEMATLLETSESAIKSRLFRARQLLAKHLQEVPSPAWAAILESA
jgi:RNA polymerase sigma-70 factor (ECF subfamily)